MKTLFLGPSIRLKYLILNGLVRVIDERIGKGIYTIYQTDITTVGGRDSFGVVSHLRPCVVVRLKFSHSELGI
jgi:hypothetical protein